MATTAQAAAFATNWNSWTIDQRINWLKYTKQWTPAKEDQLIEEWARQNFGALAVYLDLPSIGPVIKQAAREGWTEARLQAAISDTTWWKTTSAPQRQWDALMVTDPKTAQDKAMSMFTSMWTVLEQEGVGSQFSDARVYQMALTALRNGSTENDIQRLVLAEVQFDPQQPLGGRMGAQMTAIQNAADQFLVPLSEEAQFDWAKKIETGWTTQEGMLEYLRGVAKGQWGADVANAIDRGQTVRQVLDPNISLAAQLLERDPTSFDFLDPKTRDFLLVNDGQQMRAATLQETNTKVRSTDEFWQTGRAEQEASSFVLNAERLMGLRQG